MKFIICKNCRQKRKYFAKSFCEKCYWKEFRRINQEKLRQKDHEYYLKNKKIHNLKGKEYRIKHRAEIQEYRRIWYQKNKEKVAVKVKEWKIKNREKYLENSRLYWQREYVKNRHNFRKSLYRYGRSFANNSFLIKILANHKCMGCGKDDTKYVFNVHHVIPFALIRNNELWNLEYLCRACHIKREKHFKKLAKNLDIIIPSLNNIKKTS